MADGQGATYPDDAGGWAPSGRRICPSCGCPAHDDMSKGKEAECRICGCPPFSVRKKEFDQTHAMAHRDASRPTEGFH